MAPEVLGEAARRGGVVGCRALLFSQSVRFGWVSGVPHFRPTLPQKHPNAHPVRL